jgi:cold shock CspA family protein
MAKAGAKRGPKPTGPTDQQGVPASGRIARLLVGQGFGFIRLPDGRDIFFHRADVQEGTSINDLVVGELVKFDLLDDPVSGARALRVRRGTPRR